HDSQLLCHRRRVAGRDGVRHVPPGSEEPETPQSVHRAVPSRSRQDSRHPRGVLLRPRRPPRAELAALRWAVPAASQLSMKKVLIAVLALAILGYAGICGLL